MIMEKTKHLFWIFLVIAAFLIYGWYNSEQNRLKLLEEYQQAQEEMVTLRNEIEELRSMTDDL